MYSRCFSEHCISPCQIWTSTSKSNNNRQQNSITIWRGKLQQQPRKGKL